MNDLDYEKILNLEVELYDSPNTTIRFYLKKLLLMIWKERECFDGKRPFGNSDWEYDLYIPLAKANYIKALFDNEGHVKEIDKVSANKIISDVINYQFNLSADLMKP